MVENLPANAGDVGLIPGSEGISWRRKWQSTPEFFLGKYHGQGSLAGYSPWSYKRFWQDFSTKKKKKTKFDQCFLICGQMVLKSSRTILFKKHQPSFSSSQPYAWSSSTKAALKSFFFPLKSRVLFFSFFYWSIIALQCCVAAAVRSLQLCPTLCDPMDCSLPRSSVPGILQARTLEWGAIAFSSMLC